MSAADGDAAMTETPQIEEQPEWRIIEEAWVRATPLAESRRSTEAERAEAEKRLDAAAAAAQELAAAGRLAPEEAELLTDAATGLVERIYAEPPADYQQTCYRMDLKRPARQSLQRLTAQLALLGRFVDAGRLPLPVWSKVLAAAEADLTLLADQERRLGPDERHQAQTVCAAALIVVNRLRARLDMPPLPERPPGILARLRAALAGRRRAKE